MKLKIVFLSVSFIPIIVNQAFGSNLYVWIAPRLLAILLHRKYYVGVVRNCWWAELLPVE